MGGDLDQLDERSRQMVLSPPALLTLSETLHGLRERHGRIANNIADRSRALAAALDQCRQAQQCVDQSREIFARVQSELQGLQRPVGSKTEDVQTMLDTCQVTTKSK